MITYSLPSCIELKREKAIAGLDYIFTREKCQDNIYIDIYTIKDKNLSQHFLHPQTLNLLIVLGTSEYKTRTEVT